MNRPFAAGDRASLQATLTDQAVADFASVVGDRNPLHLDDDFAATSRFGRRIGHGMWAGSLISAVLGTQLPGPGTVYLSQSLRFVAPIYIGDTITAVVCVDEVRRDKPLIELVTTCTNQDGQTVVEGRAVVLADEMILPPRAAH